jgi:excisionase family DNA binding protein
MSISTTVAEPKFTITKAAAVIGISRAQVSNRLNSGKLRYYQVGGRRIIGERHLQEYLSAAERRPTESDSLVPLADQETLIR